VGPILEELHERLVGVTVECLPWQQLIARYDKPQTLFFLDPPYYGVENDYGAGLFRREEYAELAAVLEALQGRFIMTLNDVPAVRQTFAGFRMEPVALTYTVARKAGPKAAARELIIMPRRR
jgi:DNA adenine methylase